MRIPEGAPFLRAAFSLRRRSSSAFSSSSDMASPSLFCDKTEVYRYWRAVHTSSITFVEVSGAAADAAGARHREAMLGGKAAGGGDGAVLMRPVWRGMD